VVRFSHQAVVLSDRPLIAQAGPLEQSARAVCLVRDNDALLRLPLREPAVLPTTYEGGEALLASLQDDLADATSALALVFDLSEEALLDRVEREVDNLVVLGSYLESVPTVELEVLEEAPTERQLLLRRRFRHWWWRCPVVQQPASPQS